MIAAVVLAAGGSTRLGRPKQLVECAGRPLVRRAAEAALAAGCAPVVVVLGARADAVREALAGLPLACVSNPDWEQGLGGSIRCGIEAVQDDASIQAVLLMTCDQPALTAELLGQLIDAFDGAPGRRVACVYEGTAGTPALFERSLFGELLRLRGDRGAKSLLECDPTMLRQVAWPEGKWDVDRPGDEPVEGSRQP